MTSMPASRSARAITLAPRSCPSRPGLATSTRILESIRTERRLWIRRQCPPGRAVHPPFQYSPKSQRQFGGPVTPAHIVARRDETNPREKREVAGSTVERGERRRGTAELQANAVKFQAVASESSSAHRRVSAPAAR